MLDYKEEIGHIQGASTAVEMCMLLDDINKDQRAVVLASGMGGFYRGCTVWKLE